MSTHDANRRYPIALNENRWCANGTAPDGKFLGMAGAAINHCVGYRRKIVSEFCFPTTAIPAGTAGADAVFHIGCHTGTGADRIVGVFNLATANDAGAVDPFVKITATDGYSGGSATDSGEIHYGAVGPGGSGLPSDFSWGNLVEVSVDPDTDYRVTVTLTDYARVLSFCLYEVGLVFTDTTKGGVDPRRGVGSPVYDADIEQYVKACSEMWRHNAGNILQALFYVDSYTDHSISHTNETVAVNIYTGTSPVNAGSVGYRVNLQYHNSLGYNDGVKDVMPVVLAVYADADSTDANNKVIVTDGASNSIEVTNIAVGGPAWYTATGTIVPTDDQKYDIHVQTGAGDTVIVYSVCVYELD